MFDVGLQELVVILVIALLVFGPSKLPEVGRMIGRAMRDAVVSGCASPECRRLYFKNAAEASARDLLRCPICEPTDMN